MQNPVINGEYATFGRRADMYDRLVLPQAESAFLPYPF